MKLELTRRGDYAVRAMLALAEAEADDRRMSAAAIGRRMAIPASFVAQVMADLSRAGMVQSARGRRGGYRLARSSRLITLLDVVQATDGSTGLRMCVMRGSRCGEGERCQVHDAFAQGQEALLGVLGGVTLHDVAPRRAEHSTTMPGRQSA